MSLECHFEKKPKDSFVNAVHNTSPFSNKFCYILRSQSQYKLVPQAELAGTKNKIHKVLNHFCLCGKILVLVGNVF